MNANNYKIIQSLDSKETYSYGTSEDIIHKTEEIDYKNNTKMINSDDVAEENTKEHNPISPQIPEVQAQEKQAQYFV